MLYEEIYYQQLRSLPSELREASIQYRELKQIIGRVVDELNELGLPPGTLRQFVSTVDSGRDRPISHMDHHPTLDTRSKEQILSYLRSTPGVKMLYDVISESGKSFPQLRVCPTPATDDTRSTECGTSRVVPSAVRPQAIVRLQREIEEADSPNRSREANSRDRNATPVAAAPSASREFVIPLLSDAEFFNLLEGNIQVLTAQMEKVHSEFLKSVQDLAGMIADTCQPASVAGNYHPYSSVSTHPGNVEVKVRRMKSDLYAWREIFRVFEEADVFQHNSDDRKVEWSIEESERRLNAFIDKVARRGSLKEKFQHKQSAEALQIFITLNLLILNIRKAFQANIGAIQTLVKKHTERTALPMSCSFSENASVVSIGLLPRSSYRPLSGLVHPRLFLQEIAEKLFVIVPNQDDYSCAICTNVAFKPIRLSCTHLFCARCLIKMQTRGEGSCPMCRAHSVLQANAQNVDWALLNFIEDWFPREAKEKMKDNQKEVLNEQMAEWRRNDVVCRVI